MDDKTKEEERWINDIKWVVSTPQGRRFYWRLMAEAGTFKDKFVESTNYAYYLKGRKGLGLDLFHDLLSANPNSFQQMQQEQDSKKTREKIVINRQIKNKGKNPTKIDSPSLPNT